METHTDNTPDYLRGPTLNVIVRRAGRGSGGRPAGCAPGRRRGRRPASSPKTVPDTCLTNPDTCLTNEPARQIRVAATDRAAAQGRAMDVGPPSRCPDGTRASGCFGSRRKRWATTLWTFLDPRSVAMPCIASDARGRALRAPKSPLPCDAPNYVIRLETGSGAFAQREICSIHVRTRASSPAQFVLRP